MNTMVLTRQGLLYRAWSIDVEEGKITYTCVKADDPLPTDVESTRFFTVSDDEVICTYKDATVTRTLIDTLCRITDLVSRVPVWIDYVHENSMSLPDKYREDCTRYSEKMADLKRSPVGRQTIYLMHTLNFHRKLMALSKDSISVPDGIGTEDEFYDWVRKVSGAVTTTNEGVVSIRADAVDD